MSAARVVLIACVVALAGCASINTQSAFVPNVIRAEVEHVSHPLAGWPVSAANTEDALSTVGVVARWQRGALYVEHGLGYKLETSGFYGPKLTYAGRVGYEWKVKQ